MRIRDMLYSIMRLGLVQTRNSSRIAICRGLFDTGESAQMATDWSGQSNDQCVL